MKLQQRVAELEGQRVSAAVAAAMAASHQRKGTTSVTGPKNIEAATRAAEMRIKSEEEKMHLI